MSELLIPEELAKELPTIVKTELAKMDALKQDGFVEDYKRKRKSVTVASLIWLLSLQYGYLGQWGLQCLYWVTIGGCGVWALVDIFRTPGVTREMNRTLAMNILKDYKIMSA